MHHIITWVPLRCVCNIWRPACRSLKHEIGAGDAPFIPEPLSAVGLATPIDVAACAFMCVVIVCRYYCRCRHCHFFCLFFDAKNLEICKSVLQGFQVSRIEQAWDQELDPHFRSNHCCCRSKPSLIRAVFSVSGNYVFLGNLFGMVYGVALGLFRPLLIKFLLEELGSRPSLLIVLHVFLVLFFPPVPPPA